MQVVGVGVMVWLEPVAHQIPRAVLSATVTEHKMESSCLWPSTRGTEMRFQEMSTGSEHLRRAEILLLPVAPLSPNCKTLT